jgi:DNA-directed RNA polymerase specialized sigma24 family protein
LRVNLVGAQVTGDAPELLDYDDAKLLSMVRTGDIGAFGVLRQRHGDAARRLARILVSTPAEVDDVVAEAFDRVLDALKRGGGPADGFRPYLLTATRRVCASRAEARGAPIPGERPGQAGQSESGKKSEPGRPFLDPATSVDKLLIVGVFLSLPERWSALLWHLEIEQETAEEIAPLFGLSFNGLTALERRARAAFRQTYLDTYSAQLESASCMSVVDMLGGYLRYALAEGETAYVAAHLSECAQCRAVYSELSDLGATLRSAIAPVVLGGAAAAYLPGAEIPMHTAVDVAPPVAVAPTTAVEVWGAPTSDAIVLATPVAAAEGLDALGLGGVGAGGGSSGVGGRGVRPPRGRVPAGRTRALLVVGALALAAIVGVPVGLALTGHKNASPLAPGPGVTANGPGSPSPSAATSPSAQAHKRAPAKAKAKPSLSPSAATPSQPQTTPSPSSSTTQPSPSPKPSPTHRKSPKKAAKLSATIDVYGGQFWAEAFFTVTNTGNASTGALTATITLPSGTSMASGGHGHGHDWTCQPTSSGASCTASALAAGANSHGALGIQVNGSSACGQSVQLSVSGGSASTSATSPETIQCGPGGNGNQIRKPAVVTHFLT